MDPLLTQTLALALLRVVPEVAKPRRCNKHGVGFMIRELRATLPENGIGPQIGVRREVIQILESNCRACRFRGKCGMVLLE